MGLVEQVNGAIQERVDQGVDGSSKVVPVTILTLSPLTVAIQGSTTAHPAQLIDGQGARVGDTAYALWWPGNVLPLVFQVTASARPWATFTHQANNTLTNSTWSRLTGLGRLTGAGDITGASGDIVASLSGWYDVSCQVVHAYSATAPLIGAGIDVADSAGDAVSYVPTTDGGGGYQLTTPKPDASSQVLTVAGTLWADAGQHLRLWAYQNSGANQTQAANSHTFLKAIYRGK